MSENSRNKRNTKREGTVWNYTPEYYIVNEEIIQNTYKKA